MGSDVQDITRQCSMKHCLSVSVCVPMGVWLAGAGSLCTVCSPGVRVQMQAVAMHIPRLGPQEAKGTNGLAAAPTDPHVGYRCCYQKFCTEPLFMTETLLQILV